MTKIISTKRILLMSGAVCALSFFGGSTWAADAAASADTTAPTIGEIVVTAERREENLQDTPIAVSAFSADTLNSEKLNGGEDLLLQVPNTNFTRSNFGGYDFKIRGIGTDVIASGVSGTAGVSINLNEMPVTANHFQDEEFYDVDRVEVLRGPQGTLYGRNATGGAVDLITTQPSSQFGGYGTVQYGNYNSVKVTGAVNIPLGDMFAIRIAGTRLVQDGFGENTYLHERVDGRDLGSIRTTISFKPNDKFSAYLLYEHFGEDDDRNRVGKQLCVTDPGPTNVGGVPIAPAGGPVATNYAAFLNQGCIAGSLYQPAAYGTINSNGTLSGELANLIGLNNGTNVFGNNPLQNTNLHDIQSVVQPTYKALEDLFQLHMAYNLTDNLTLTSITGFNRETYAESQDYDRVVPAQPYQPVGVAALLFPNGVVRDPQTGTSNLLTSFDYSSGESKEYTEELRLASSFSGKINFSVGGYFSEETAPFNAGTNYYVESNALTAYSQLNNYAYNATYAGYLAAHAPPAYAAAAAAAAAPAGGLINIDGGYPPNGSGHNYYDSRTGGGNLKSYAGFGEVYYNITKDLKLTLGGRYTEDNLYNLQYPISLLSATPNNGPSYPGGAVGGFPSTICTTSVSACLVPQYQSTKAFTGRANLDWTPTLSFTDKTLIYASYSRGYKGGGFNTACQSSLGQAGGSAAACGYPLSYAPEYIDAYEIGTKNTALHGALTLDLTGFYYNYTGYQISSIINESSVNSNINAKIYGVEFESVYSPLRNLTFNANVGYLHSSIDSGQSAIDELNLNQGNAAYTVVKTTAGSNCLAPTRNVAGYILGGYPAAGLSTQCAASGVYAAGIPEQLGGNKLPNTPPVTLSLGAQYVFELPKDWKATLRADYYWQDNSWARVFNAVNDYLQSYHIVNATLTFVNVGSGITVQGYVKNLFNAQPITGTYITDATSGLFTNVFTLDPRTYGLQVTKRF